MDEIIISGNKVSLRTIQELKNINIEDFYSHLARNIGIRTPILPEKVIAYASKENRHVYMTHQSPGRVVLTVRLNNDNKTYEVALPNIYFFHSYVNMAFEGLYVFGSGSKIYTDKDLLCRLPFRNLYPDCKVCLGRDLVFGLEGTLSSKIYKLEKHFWDSLFNRDLDSVYMNAAPHSWKEHGDPLEYWSSLSMNGNFNSCEVEWLPMTTVSKTISKILED